MRKFAFLLLFLAGPLFTHAQVDLYGDPGLQIESSPELPGPSESARLSLTDYERRFFGAKIAWYKNNELIPGSEGQREITYTAPIAGAKETVEAALTLLDGSTYVVSRTFEPMYVDIILEPQTHVPRFYTGRALPSVGSLIHATALVSNGPITNSTFVYRWYVNQNILEAGPIRGRNNVTFTTPQGSELILSLEVSRTDGKVVGKRAVVVPIVPPELHFYEVNELYGMGQRAITSLTLIGNSTVLKAEPYYLSSEVYNNPSVLEWNVDGQKTNNSGSNPYQITIQSTGVPGTANIGFRVQSTTQFLQGARKGINVSI